MDKCATVAHLMACTDTAMTLRWAEDDELQHYLEWRSAASDAWTGCVVTSPALRTSLKPDTAYSLRMRCRRKGSMKWSEPSLPQVFKTPCLLPMPLQPHTIRAERVTHSTAVISWDLEENVPDGCMNEIVRYRVCLNKVSAKTLEEEEGEEGYCTSCSCAFEGLKPGTEYAASVSRMNASRLWSAALPHLVFRTEFTTPASVELENIEALPTDGDEMTLRWIAPRRNGADILGYDIAVTRLSTRDERTERTGPRSEVVLKDLSPDSWYSIRLRANNAMGPADWSQPLEVKTNAPTFLTPSISLVDAQADSLTVAWERPDCHKQAVDTYTLQMSRGSTVFADLASFDAMASTCYSHRHGPLPAYTKVTYRLTCTSSRDGEDVAVPPGPASTFRTLASRPAQVPRPRWLAGAGTVVWDAPFDCGEPVLAFAVRVTDKARAALHCAEVPPDELRHPLSFEGTEGERAFVTVAARNALGTGMASPPLELRVSRTGVVLEV